MKKWSMETHGRDRVRSAGGVGVHSHPPRVLLVRTLARERTRLELRRLVRVVEPARQLLSSGAREQTQVRAHG